MAAPPRPFTIDRGRVRVRDALLVYLERTIAPPSALPTGVAPRAYGLSPIGLSPSGSIVAAVEPGEAVWLGFQAVDPTQPAVVRVRVDRADPLDAITGGVWEEALSEEPRNYLVCPPDSRLPGLRRPTGHRPFAPAGDAAGEKLSVIHWSDVPTVVPVELLRPETFTALTDLVPEALDPESAYKGWRLP